MKGTVCFTKNVKPFPFRKQRARRSHRTSEDLKFLSPDSVQLGLVRGDAVLPEEQRYPRVSTLVILHLVLVISNAVGWNWMRLGYFT